MRTKEDFIEEFFSVDCFYWTEDTEKTNKVLEVAKFLEIPFQGGYYQDEERESPLTRLTIFKRDDGTKYIQRINFWNPNYGLKVRNENAMYSEFLTYVK